MIIIKG